MQEQYPYSTATPNREFYEKSITYKKVFSGLTLDFYKRYFNIIDKHTTGKCIIIDAGCGIGKTTAQISNNRKVIGIDWSLEFLKQAKQSSSYVSFIQGDLCRIPIANDSIDFIGAYDILEHIYDAEKFFKETKRILRKGAKLLIVSPNNISPLMPLLNFYYSKRCKFGKGHRRFIPISELLLSEVMQLAYFIKELFSRKFVFRYRKLDAGLIEYPDEDAVFYTSFFIVRYLKKNGFKIFKNMAAPVTNIKYLFAKVFPYFFTTTYIIAMKE